MWLTIVVVTGLPRSGTSLMMAMLDSGGIPPLTDNIRQADVDNPKGYYEFERVKKLPDDTGWLPEAEGKAVKVLAELIVHLPSDREYKVIFMMRELPEIIASQKKMMKRRGEDPDKVPDAELMSLYRSYLRNLKSIVNRSPNMKALYVSYNELMADPSGVLKELEGFLGGWLDMGAMKDAIDANLYRNRSG
jgi:hypothetical protein